MNKNLKKFLNSNEDGTYFVGHASVLTRIDGKLIIIDFIRNINFFLDSWYFFPKLEWTRELIKKLDYVFISHSHEDHWDPPLLKKLPKKIKIFLPEKRVGFEKFLSTHKKRVNFVPPNKILKIDSTISVMALPSDHNSIDSSYFIKGKNFSVYHGNDNFLSPHLVKEATKKFGRVNHAYIPFAYVWWYPFCLTSISSGQRKREGKRLAAKNMYIGAEISKALKPDLVVPFAANMVYYNPKSVINKETANTFDFSSYCKKKYKSLYKKIQNFFPGDYALRKKNKEDFIVSQNLSKKKYFKMLNTFLNKAARKYNKEYSSLIIDEKLRDISNYQKKLSKLKKTKLDRDIYITLKNKKSKMIKIDSYEKKISLAHKFEKKKNSYIFYFEPKPLKAWLNGKVSFEDILNSQRFTVDRYPEEFRPKIWNYIRNYL